MGIKEDAEAAYAKTVEVKDAKTKAEAEKLAADQAAAEIVARKRVKQWASNLGYPGQAVIGDVTFPKNDGRDIITQIEFKIDDLEFTGMHVGQSPLVKVKLHDSTNQDIHDLEQLGKAIAEAKDERERRGRWQ